MVKRYQGGLISANNSPTNISETSGFFNISQQMQAKQEGLWPQANNKIDSSSGTIFTSTRQVVSGQVIQYKYHAFLSSSTFVTTGNGVVDILVVGAGGGGAGWVVTETFGDIGLNATNNVRLLRQAAPNMGGGGASGWRASSSADAGYAGGSGLVVIRYKI